VVSESTINFASPASIPRFKPVSVRRPYCCNWCRANGTDEGLLRAFNGMIRKPSLVSEKAS
jgi:hypothetical protein